MAIHGIYVGVTNHLLSGMILQVGMLLVVNYLIRSTCLYEPKWPAFLQDSTHNIGRSIPLKKEVRRVGGICFCVRGKGGVGVPSTNTIPLLRMLHPSQLLPKGHSLHSVGCVNLSYLLNLFLFKLSVGTGIRTKYKQAPQVWPSSLCQGELSR